MKIKIKKEGWMNKKYEISVIRSLHNVIATYTHSTPFPGDKKICIIIKLEVKNG